MKSLFTHLKLHVVILVTLLAWSAAIVGAQPEPFLIKDINTSTEGVTSSPNSFVTIGTVTFFSATDSTNGTELWKSDGTTAGTMLVKDIYPNTGNSTPQNLVNVNGTLFFTATDPTNGTELWKSDGTTAGTVLVKDIYPGTVNSNPLYLTDVNGTLFFMGTDPTNGAELWKSDGTADGTVMLKDIYPGTGNSFPTYLSNVNGTLFFIATDQTYGQELWKSDGTAAGTVMVKDIYPGTGNPPPQYLTNVNGTLFFKATDPTNGAELWKSDGTAAGTVLVKDIYPGASGSSPAYLTNVNGTLFFTATDPTNGLELWKSDGTAAGTAMAKDIYPGTVNSTPLYLTNINGMLFFMATDPTNGTELWKSDGTADGTVLVKDIYPGASSSSPGNLANVDGTLFFSANDGTNGRELWKSDGTAAGTGLIKDIYPAGNSTPGNLTDVNGTLFFSANDPTSGLVMWKSDGTAAGTVMIKNITPGTGNSNPAYLTNINGTLYFQAYDPTNGYELWKSDGTPAGTVLVKDIIPGTGNSTPAYLTSANGTLFFKATDPTYGQELWKSDGTATGTVMVKDIYTGAGNSTPQNLVNVNGTLFFTGTTPTNGTELWKSDGTATGTVLVKDINPGATGSNPAYLTNENGTLFFKATDPINGTELWKSDGTAVGTVLVKDINPGAGNSSPANLTSVNITLYFTAYDPINGYELWKSDGTAAGTMLVRDIYTGITGSSPANLTNVNGTLFFTATDPTNGTELWKSNGTTAGTMLVKDISPGATSSGIANLANVNGTLFFTATDLSNGTELWKSDGTAAGTVLVKDINPGATGSGIANLTNMNGTLFFSATDGTNGTELWMSDGTAAGTVLVKDISPGAGNSSPANLTNANDNLFFTARTPANGQELWILALVLDSIPPVSAITSPANGATLILGNITVSGTASDAVSGVATVEVSTDGGITWASATDTSGNGSWSTWSYPPPPFVGTYSFRSRATDKAVNVEIPGPGVTVTVIAPPTAVTDPATAIATIGATLNGSVYANNSQTTVTFEYGQTTGYGFTAIAAQSPLAANGGGSVSATVAGLACGTTYHFRVTAVSSVGSTTGSDATFATVPCPPPGGITISTFAGNGASGYNGDTIPAPTASLYYPYAVATDSAGDVYIADTFNSRIRKVTTTTGIIGTVAGNGTSGSAGDGGIATSAQINCPYGVAVASAGNIYIADTYNHLIRKVDASNGTISTIAGLGFYNGGYNGDGIAATAAKINWPKGIAVDAAGNVYFADYNNHRIRRIDAVSGLITTVAGNGTGTFAGDGGAATTASLYYPNGVALDSSGNLFIADSLNMRIRRVDAVSGTITTVAGKSATGYITYTGEGGPATSATLPNVGGPAVDGAGNIFITSNNRVLKVSAATGIIITVAGNDTADIYGDGGLATGASLHAPKGLAFDGAGNMYIADTYNHRVRKVIKDGPTTASITYTPAGPYKAGDLVTITATFNDLVADAPVPQIALSGANTLAATNMIKVDYTHYSYTHTIAPGSGTVTFSLPGGTDVNGVPLSSTPISGAAYISLYTLTYTAGINGEISGTTPQTVSTGGSGSAVSALPATGYHFVNWSDGSTANPRNDTNVAANISVSATFAPNTHTLDVIKTGTGDGTVTADIIDTIVCGATCSYVYDHGTSVSLLASPDSHSTFTEWLGACSGTTTCVVTMDDIRTVYASFALAPKAKNPNTGQQYPLLALALLDTPSGGTLHLLDIQFDGNVNLEKGVVLIGGWNSSFTVNSGTPTILKGDVTVLDGDSATELIDIHGGLVIKGGSLSVRGITIR